MLTQTAMPMKNSGQPGGALSESAAIIDRAYKLESLLRILTLATDGEQISGKTFEHCGGGAVLEMAADMAGEIVSVLEIAEHHKKPEGVQ